MALQGGNWTEVEGKEERIREKGKGGEGKGCPVFLEKCWQP